MYDFNQPTDTLGCPDWQEFVDEGPNDPAKLAALSKRLRRPKKRSPWFWRALVAGAVTAALLVGLLIGHFVL
jgi:hypothetical protein